MDEGYALVGLSRLRTVLDVPRGWPVRAFSKCHHGARLQSYYEILEV